MNNDHTNERKTTISCAKSNDTECHMNQVSIDVSISENRVQRLNSQQYCLITSLIIHIHARH